MKRLLAYILTIIFFAVANGEVPADSVKIHFRVGQSRLEASYDGNGEAIDAFIRKLRGSIDNGTLESVKVEAFASPEGQISLNERLARERCSAIVDYLTRATGLGSDKVKAAPGGIAWEELRKMVAENPDVPARRQILDILDNSPQWDYDSQGKAGSRNKKLMDLQGGVPYKWMQKNLFPELRNAVAISYSIKEIRPAAPETPAVEENPENQTGAEDESEPQEIPGDQEELPQIDEIIAEEETIEIPDSGEIDFMRDRREPYRHLFALKTNLLYYAALMPNLEFEWLINEDWSVAAEGDVAWWKNSARERTYQLALLSVEGRRWFLQRAPWHGLYVGLFAGGGWYDLQNGNGYRGEGGMGGVSVGYMWKIGRCWSMEAGIGGGYMYTKYKEYEPRDGHHMYLRTRKLGYFGPLKLKLSIAWRFGNLYKKETTIPTNEE